MELTILTGPLIGHGGEETVLKEFISSLQDEYIFNLLVPEQLGDESWVDDIRPYLARCRMNKENSKISKLKFILENLRTAKDTAVICFTPRMVFLADLAKKMFRKKYLIVSWMHFSISAKFDKFTAKQLLKADYHFAISSGIQSELVSLGVPKNKIALIYNPVLKQDNTIRPDANQTRFICVSRIQFKEQKNLSELFKALGLLNISEKWSLDIYGADDSVGQQEKEKCIELADRLGIQNHINWCGWYKNVWEEIDAADCLLLSSTYEGFPMALLEAVSRGIPVISADCPVGPADIVSNQNGFLYQMGDIKAFASFLKNFVEKKYNFNPTVVKNSINKMYLDAYRDNIKRILNDWMIEK